MSRRSPVNFWLLLAATICTDVVSMSWVYGGMRERAEGLFLALVCGQINALCVWASFSRRPLPRSIAVFVLAIAAAVWAGLSNLVSGESFQQMVIAYASLWLTQSILLLTMLWFFLRTPYGRHWGQAADGRHWQFSTSHLLVFMTILAILIFLLQAAELVHEVWLWIILWIINNVAVALACVLLHSTRWHGVVRFAATACVAAILGSLLYLIDNWPVIIALNLIHAGVMFAWLQIGGIMPIRDEATSADRPGNNQ